MLVNPGNSESRGPVTGGQRAGVIAGRKPGGKIGWEEDTLPGKSWSDRCMDGTRESTHGRTLPRFKDCSMSLPSKTSSLQTYHLALFRAAIHPEFFQIEGRSRIKHGEYEFEA